LGGVDVVERAAGDGALEEGDVELAGHRREVVEVEGLAGDMADGGVVGDGFADGVHSRLGIRQDYRIERIDRMKELVTGFKVRSLSCNYPVDLLDPVILSKTLNGLGYVLVVELAEDVFY
jgi:hypothetical protein